jgi:hypothetical protein
LSTRPGLRRQDRRARPGQGLSTTAARKASTSPRWGNRLLTELAKSQVGQVFLLSLGAAPPKRLDHLGACDIMDTLHLRA